MVDETAIKVGSEYVWLWAAIEPKNRKILAITVSKERNMFVAERFIAGLAKAHGKHPVSTDGGDMVSTSMPVPETRPSHSFTL